MIFDFTPDPKVLIALTHTTMKPLDALCELIDNSIDSFLGARIQGVPIDNPMILVTLPSARQIAGNTGKLRIQDNGPGMTAEAAERAIRAGFSGNNPYDTLGLFGMGFNISTGKLGNRTTMITARKDMAGYVKTVINLSRINNDKNYNLEANEIPKGDSEPFQAGGHGTIIEIDDWWPRGTPNRSFIERLLRYSPAKIRGELGRRYATILRENKIKIIINGEKCEPFEHCVWDDSRFVVRRNGNVPAVMRFDQVLKTTKRCANCTAVLGSDDAVCPACGSSAVRSVEERVRGWIGIQRFDDATEFGIDLIRHGRAIRTREKKAFFEFTDDLGHEIKDYPIDSTYGRIVGEVHLDFVPVDFMKQDFQRTSAEWQDAMSFIRGDSSLQPNQPGASENHSPMFKLFQAYRRVRNCGKADMYMGYWDPDSRGPKRISRDTEKEYYQKFKQRLPGFFDDSEWWKLVETADQQPVEEIPECPDCGTQNLREAEVCEGCGRILRGKTCIAEGCGAEIPASALTCPLCGASQIPMVIEPWLCAVCGNRNLATDDCCGQCGSRRGSRHPLSAEELLATSVKADSLSSEGTVIKLADGSDCNPVRVSVYASQGALRDPQSNRYVPLIVSKLRSWDIAIFVDFTHPMFSRCRLSKEQVVAGEVALYLYTEYMHLASKPEHTLSNIMWSVLRANWMDSIDVSREAVLDEAKELIADIACRLYESNGSGLSQYFDAMDTEQKRKMVDSMLQGGVDIAAIRALKESGEYLKYVPPGFLLFLYSDGPEMFFGGKVWNKTLAGSYESLLGPDVMAQTNRATIDQYGNCLKDVIMFMENKYSDVLVLQRTRLSMEFLRKDMGA